MTDLAHQFLILCTVLLINYIKALFTILGKAPDLFTHKLTSTRCRTENHRFYPSFEYKQNKFTKMNYVIYPLTRLGEICFYELIHPFLGLNLNRLELVELWKMTLAPEGASWECALILATSCYSSCFSLAMKVSCSAVHTFSCFSRSSSPPPRSYGARDCGLKPLQL